MSIASLKEKYEAQLQTLWVSCGEDVLELSVLVIKPEWRERGVGTKIMRELIQMSESSGVPLALTPTSEFGGSKRALEKWYKRLGFVPNRGRHKCWQTQMTMIRHPG